MKRMWLFGPFIVLLLASPLLGDEKNENEISKNTFLNKKKVNCPPKKTQTCTTCCPGQPSYRLPADFTGANSFAEYLLWQVQEQASHFVITPNDDSVIDPNYLNTEGLGKLRSASFNWASGVRVGLGFTMERDAWQTLAQYTWFSTSGKKSFSIHSTSPTPTDYLMPTSYAQSLTGIVSASNKVKFSYQMADLLLARTFLVTQHIRLNFSFGGSGGYIKENFRTTYGATNKTYVLNHWSFGGGGFRAALDSNWHVGHGFGIFGRASFAPLLGHYSIHNHIFADSPISPGSPGAIPSRPAKISMQKILLVPTTQIALGFDWCRSFTKCAINALRVAITGEFNNLPNLQQFFKVIDNPSDPTFGKNPSARDFSSVYMYGGNIRVGADY